jgi:hypothetical protein
MAIIKLANAGDAATWKVTDCETVAGKFGSQVKFTAENGDILFISAETAERQLNRCGLTTETAIGETLTFSRQANTKTPGAAPYWSIEVAGPQAAPSKRLPAPVQTEVVGGLDARMSIANAYLALYRHVRTALPQEAAEAVQAATATIWITWDKRGIQPDGKDAAKQTTTSTTSAGPTIPTTPPPSGKRLPSPSSAVRGSPAGEPDFSKFPPPSDADFTDDLPFD